jgi:hypothetical protein
MLCMSQTASWMEVSVKMHRVDAFRMGARVPEWLVRRGSAKYPDDVRRWSQ